MFNFNCNFEFEPITILATQSGVVFNPLKLAAAAVAQSVKHHELRSLKEMQLN